MNLHLWKDSCRELYCIDFCDRKAITPGMIPFRHRDCRGCLLLEIYELNGGYDA